MHERVGLPQSESGDPNAPDGTSLDPSKSAKDINIWRAIAVAMRTASPSWPDIRTIKARIRAAFAVPIVEFSATSRTWGRQVR